MILLGFFDTYHQLIEWLQKGKEYILTHPGETILVLIAIVLTGSGKYIWHIILWIKDNSAMKKHSRSLPQEFDNPNFKLGFANLVEILKHKVAVINTDTKWNSKFFTPLDAEVEIKKDNRIVKKVTDLFKAIKLNQSCTSFLILGDPGSGKSVALRKLWEELLKESNKTKKIPIYLNLKEWVVTGKWTSEYPPTSYQLIGFIRKQLSGQNAQIDGFLDLYFEKLYANGHFFLILDSFDEIPMVLDESENSWLIDKLSEVIFLTIVNSKESRGILSSREFRKPTNKFKTPITLVIRPFTIQKIRKTLEGSINFTSDLFSLLFTRRFDLIPIIRNPFATSLLEMYVQNNPGQLPRNQAELYSNYIENCLNDFKKYNLDATLSKQVAIEKAKEVAFYIFNSKEYGLEIPVRDAIIIFGKEIEEVFLVFEYTRIGRISHGFEKKFSFVHRRFYEYFVALKLLDNEHVLFLESIPNDSRWRDSLVMFTEIAPEKIAIKIAEFCWHDYISLLDKKYVPLEKKLKSIHALRFLIDAFRTRKECLHTILPELEEYLENTFPKGHRYNCELLELYIASQAIGLISEDKVPNISANVLHIQNSWLSETAINSCRHLPSLNDRAIISLLCYYDALTDKEFIHNFFNNLKALKLSSSFKIVYNFLVIKFVYLLVVYTALVGMIILQPLVIIPIFILELIMPSLSINLEYHFNDKFQKKSEYYLGGFFSAIPKKSNMIRLIIVGISLAINFYLPNSKTFGNKNLLVVLEFLILPLSILFVFICVKKLYPFDNKNFYLNTNDTSSNSSINLVPKSTRGTSKSDRHDLTTRQKVTLISLGSVVVSLALLLFYFREFVIKYIVPIVLLSLFVFLLFKMCKKIVYIIKDRGLLGRIRQTNKNDTWNREIIESYFYAFKTKAIRLRFVRMMEFENIKAVGQWKSFQTPNINNDETSSKLSQLDAKWRGFDL